MYDSNLDVWQLKYHRNNVNLRQNTTFWIYFHCVSIFNVYFNLGNISGLIPFFLELSEIRLETRANKTSLTSTLFCLSRSLYPDKKLSGYVICVLRVSILILCFYDFSIRFWNCSDSVVFYIDHFISDIYRH